MIIDKKLISKIVCLIKQFWVGKCYNNLFEYFEAKRKEGPVTEYRWKLRERK